MYSEGSMFLSCDLKRVATSSFTTDMMREGAVRICDWRASMRTPDLTYFEF